MGSTVYSQGNEQEVIANYFGSKVGKLLDIGAHDGEQYSNSLALIESGWQAVLVEPNPDSMAKLIARHGKNKSVTLVNAAVTPTQYLMMEFWASPSAASTSIEAFKCAWEDKEKIDFSPVWIAPITAQTLATLAGPVDFVTIDVEDNNLALAEAMKDYLGQASLVCIEHSSCGLTCAPRLQEIFEHELPFKLIAATGENFIFAK